MGISFNQEHAVRYGVDEAILIHLFQMLLYQNKANSEGCHDGKTWVRASHKELARMLPFWGSKRIMVIIQRMEVKGILVKGNYNLYRTDNTNWYSFVDEKQLTSY